MSRQRHQTGQITTEGFDQNRIWLASIGLNDVLQEWSTLLAPTVREIQWCESKNLRRYIYTIPTTTARAAQRVVGDVKDTIRFASAIVASFDHLPALPEAG